LSFASLACPPTNPKLRLVANQHGPIKTFTLRGIKESPPYFHDGRLLTLEDTIEFFTSIA
jgi:cytochrome c peroxidase